jgi:hypothetical protein
MLVAGKWLLCDDGVTRPVVEANVIGDNGIPQEECFLVDCCADRTVLSAALLNRLQLPTQPAPSGVTLQGISGSTPYAVVTTVIELTRDDGGLASIRGSLAAFTDPLAADLSILGRDCLNNFDLILSWRRNEVLLLAPNHDYQVIRP